MELIQRKKTIFKVLHDTIQLTPKVLSYADESEEHHIDMYIGANRPDIGLTTYSTIGLSEYSIGLKNKAGKEIRVEFIGMCDSDFLEFPNIIASCAFNIIKDNYSCAPGMVNPNVIDLYYDGLEMRHIYYTYPIYWDSLREKSVDDHIVKWLLAIPISDNELEYLNKNGVEAFESLLEQNDTEVFDIYRKSTV